MKAQWKLNTTLLITCLSLMPQLVDLMGPSWPLWPLCLVQSGSSLLVCMTSDDELLAQTTHSPMLPATPTGSCSVLRARHEYSRI